MSLNKSHITLPGTSRFSAMMKITNNSAFLLINTRNPLIAGFKRLGLMAHKGSTTITREAFIQDAFQAMSALVTFGVTEADAAEFISSSITRGRERAGNLSTFAPA